MLCQLGVATGSRCRCRRSNTNRPPYRVHGGINAVFRVVALHRRLRWRSPRVLALVRLAKRMALLTPADDDGGEDGDDAYDHQQFDQGEGDAALTM